MSRDGGSSIPSEARDRTIASLAILKVNYDRQGLDYVDYFVPFVGEVMRLAASTPVSVEDVDAGVKSQFGLRIPNGALRTILRRAVSRRLAIRVTGGYEPNRGQLEVSDFAAVKEDALRQQALLLDRFIEYSAPYLERRATHEEASAAMLGYVERCGIAFLRSVLVAGSQVPLQPSGSTGLPHLANGFVVHLSRSDLDGFKALETLVKGAVLAGAIHATDLGRIRSRFERLDVYLDTRILLRLLGLAGAQQEVVARELVDLTYGLGATLYCFDHTVSEIRGVLASTAHALRYRGAFRANTGETLEFLASLGYQSSDVELIIAELESRLRAARVSVRARPPHVPAWTIDEHALENNLKAGVSYRAEEALRHDVDAVTAIHRLRRGEPQQLIENARAIFVTTNAPLAQVANVHFTENRLIGSIPLVYTEQEFATIAWLKSPSQAPDLPVNLVIADSLAALRPPEALWRWYLSEIDKLERLGGVTGDEYFLLRFSTSAKSALMDLTPAQPDTFDAGLVPEILDRARRAIVAEAEPELCSAAVRQLWPRCLSESRRRSASARSQTAVSTTLSAPSMRSASTIDRGFAPTRSGSDAS